MLLVGRQQMCAPQPQQLQAVLDGAQEPVGAVEGVHVGHVHVAGAPQLGQGLERVG